MPRLFALKARSTQFGRSLAKKPEPGIMAAVWSRARSSIVRPVVFLGSILIFLCVAYWPAQLLFQSTGDVTIYQSYVRGTLASPVES